MFGVAQSLYKGQQLPTKLLDTIYEINKLIHHVEHCNEEDIFMSLNITIILI